jgi:hypothetical protein
MKTVFLSYSHRDEDFRDELEVNLKMLKRLGLIDVWHDRRIVAGSDVDHSISNELEKSDIILLLVSQYFIASDYCYDIEMTRAMERHHNGEAVVIPVILRVCDWHSAPFGKLLAVPKDGKAITKYADMGDAYLEIVMAIKEAIKKITPASQPTTPLSRAPLSTNKVNSLPRSSNLRVKKEFTDKHKDDFKDESFEYVANFFEGSLAELCNRNPQLEYKFKRIDANHFTAYIYKDGNAVSQCKIWMSERSFFGDIVYSADTSSSDNSANDFVTLDNDGHQMYFNNSGFTTHHRTEGSKLSQEGVAEQFWENLIGGLQ